MKRFISFFTALCMTLMFFGIYPVSADDVHIHKVCANLSHENCTHSENIEYEPFSFDSMSISSDKNYYLTGDIDDDTLKNGYMYISGATVNFCLNGHSVDTKGIIVRNNGTLNICDCQGGGCMKNTLYTSGVVIADPNGKINIYGGRIRAENGMAIHCGDDSVTNIYYGDISTGNGGSIMVGNRSTLSIYGGTVQSGTDGSGIDIADNSTVTINGGTINGEEQGILANYRNSTVNINGGSVTGTNLAAVFLQNGSVCNINGGTVTGINHSAVYALEGGTANISGGNVIGGATLPTVWVGNEGTVNINNGIISNSSYKSYIWNSGTLNISGGTFSKDSGSGYIRNYGSFSLQGSSVLENTSIWLSSDDNITISGALTNTSPYAVFVDSTVPRTFTNSYATYMSDSNVLKYFSSPYSSVKIAYRNGEAVLTYYYNITYDANGGTCSIQTVSANASDKLDSLATPTRDGYSFDGWFTEEDSGVQITADTVFTSDTTIYAHWTCSEHNWSNDYEKNDDQHWQICTKCNSESEKSDHVWDSGVVTKTATCTENGVLTYTCTVCNMTKIEDIAVTAHSYGTDWVTSDTSHWHECTACGEKSDMAIHIWNAGEVIEEATEDKEGMRLLTCTVCSATKTETIPALSHTHEFSDQWSSDETSHWHGAICGHSDQKADLAVHIEDSGTVTIEPTYASAGVKTFACNVCGYIMRTEDIPQLVDEHVHNFGTAWEYDDINHWHECNCGEKSEISAHIPSGWVVVTPATTEQEGLRTKSCTICGLELERDTIERLPDVGGSTGYVTEDVVDTAGTNAELVQNNTLIENTLTPEDIAAVENGSSFKIVLEVTDIRDSVSTADAAAASSVLRSNEKIGIYVDLSLFKIKDGTDRTLIHNARGKIGITLKIPENIYAGDRTYSIIRVHNGTAENLGGTYDKTTRELTFYTDKFSTYAIAYAVSSSSTDKPSMPPIPPSIYPILPIPSVVTPIVTETTDKTEDEVIFDEPYTEDVSSDAGITADSDIIDFGDNSYFLYGIVVIAILGIGIIYFKKSKQK